MSARDEAGHSRDRRESKSRLPLFVAFSLLLHGALTFTLHTEPEAFAVTQPIGSPLIGTLIQPVKSSAPPLSASTVALRVAPKKIAARKPLLDTAKPTTTIIASATPSPAVIGNVELPSSETRDDTEQDGNPANQLQEVDENFLLGEIRNLLSHYLIYPSRARKRGWEGEVLVGFVVDADGRLGSVHLARSSGYSLLDESALAALGRITHIPLSESQSLQPMKLQLPVVYQLREG